jgi:predicted phosphate transport protein (TIGR00153 family)
MGRRVFGALNMAMRWFHKLLPRDDRFFDLFESHSGAILAAAEALHMLFQPGADIAGLSQTVIDKENEADLIAREVMQAVRRTFITPFDRSDIQDLIQSMDDAVDQMNQTVKTVGLFEVGAFDPLMREMTSLAVEAAKRTAQATPLLREIVTNAGDINAYTEAIIQLEGKSDQLHDEGLRDLFHRHRNDAMAYIIGSDIYNHLEKVLDRFEDVAERMNGIVIEHV